MIPRGPTLRLQLGLENVDDLKADLERGFAALTAASSFDRTTLRTHPLPPRQPGITALRHRGLRHSPVARGKLRTFAEWFSLNDNHPFTMKVKPVVRSTKTFTPQVPLYL
jgi:hypothetical protein